MIRYAFGSTILKTAVLPQTDLVNENEVLLESGLAIQKNGQSGHRHTRERGGRDRGDASAGQGPAKAASKAAPRASQGPWGQLPLTNLRRIWPCRHPEFGPLASRTRRREPFAWKPSCPWSFVPAGRAEHRVLRTVSRRHVSQCVPLVLRLVLRVRGAVAFGCLPSAGLMGSNPEFWFLLISAETDCLHVWHVPLVREKTPAHSPLSVLNTKLSLGRASFIINEVPLLYPFAVVNNLSQY